MKTIITRAGSGSKVVCLGNLAQFNLWEILWW
jgi:predicted ribonuclease YlaK